jgi:uncharacterized membrane protein YhaH (DUF805 family)
MMNDRLAECYAGAWRKTFDYKNCATRKEFWSFILVSTLPSLCSGAVLLIALIWVDLWVVIFCGIGLATVMSFFSVIIIFLLCRWEFDACTILAAQVGGLASCI